jgi:hypothetical protein
MLSRAPLSRCCPPSLDCPSGCHMRASEGTVHEPLGNLFFGRTLAGCQLSGLEASGQPQQALHELVRRQVANLRQMLGWQCHSHRLITTADLHRQVEGGDIELGMRGLVRLLDHTLEQGQQLARPSCFLISEKSEDHDGFFSNTLKGVVLRPLVPRRSRTKPEKEPIDRRSAVGCAGRASHGCHCSVPHRLHRARGARCRHVETS